MARIIKKPQPLVFPDYANAGSAYSRVTISRSAWTEYGKRKWTFIELNTRIAAHFQESGFCPDWLWGEYTEAREAFLTITELIEQEFTKPKRTVVKENESHRFNDDDTTTVSLKEDI